MAQNQASVAPMGKGKKSKVVRYNKWGYIFLIPFIAVFLVFNLIPLISTFYNSFFENYMAQLNHVGPNFVGFQNYKTLLQAVRSGSMQEIPQ